MHQSLNFFSYLSVAPESVTIEGPDTAKVNDTLNFKCETANSNPPATVQWVVDGRSMHATFSHSVRLFCEKCKLTFDKPSIFEEITLVQSLYVDAF